MRGYIMKRLFIILIAALAVIGVAVTAYADMGSPVTMEFDAVTNRDVTAYENEWTETGTVLKPVGNLKSGTKVRVDGVYDTVNGKRYVSIQFGDKDDTDGSGIFFIEADSVNSVNDVIGKEKAGTYNDPFKIIVLSKKGIPIKSGPAEAFKTIGTIPKDTIVECTAGVLIGDDNGYSSDVYSYISYNGTTGWIYTENNGGSRDFAMIPVEDPEFDYQFSTIVTKVPIKLYSEPFNEGYATVQRVPANTELKVKYYIEDRYRDLSDDFYSTYYCEYKGRGGWTSNQFRGYGDLAWKNDWIVYFYEDADLYETADKSSAPVGKLKAEHKFYTADAAQICEHVNGDNWFRLDYNGRQLWADMIILPDSINGIYSPKSISVAPCTAQETMRFRTSQKDGSKATVIEPGENFIRIEYGLYYIDSQFYMSCELVTEDGSEAEDGYDEGEYKPDPSEGYLTGTEIEVNIDQLNDPASLKLQYPVYDSEENMTDETTEEETAEEETAEAVTEDTEEQIEIITEPQVIETNNKDKVITCTVIVCGLALAAAATIILIKKKKI